MGTQRPSYEFVSTAMSTTVSVQLVGAHPLAEALAAEAMAWFRRIEATCSRFDDTSELTRLCRAAPATTAVSPLLFEVLRVALAVAAASEGAFDPTLGALLHAHGFDRHWQTGRTAPTPSPPPNGRAHWRDIVLHEPTGQVSLPTGVALDLGAVAKGFALDLARRALATVADCCVVAGGDLLCRGHNALGRPWRTAVVDPFVPDRSAGVIEVDAPEYAICTSGGYARSTARGHHLLDPAQPEGRSAAGIASVTVIAPQAAIADALATAVFVLGADRGRALLTAQGVDALLIDASGTRHVVEGWGRTDFTGFSAAAG
jgi:thiamine biosynthesis lipoprotein